MPPRPPAICDSLSDADDDDRYGSSSSADVVRVAGEHYNRTACRPCKVIDHSTEVGIRDAHSRSRPDRRRHVRGDGVEYAVPETKPVDARRSRFGAAPASLHAHRGRNNALSKTAALSPSDESGEVCHDDAMLGMQRIAERVDGLVVEHHIGHGAASGMDSLLGLGPQQYVISVGVGMVSDDGGSRRVDQSTPPRNTA